MARGSFRGRLVAVGLLGYFAYMYLEYAVTWAFGPLFALFIASMRRASWESCGSAGSLVAEGVSDRFDDSYPRRSWAALSLGMAVLLTVLWAGRIIQGLSGRRFCLLHGETTMTIQALDLGIVVPTAVVTALLALQRHPAGMPAAASFAVTFVAMSAAIGSMLVSAWLATGVSSCRRSSFSASQLWSGSGSVSGCTHRPVFTTWSAVRAATTRPAVC